MRPSAPNPQALAEKRNAQDIAELQKLIALAIAGQISHQSFLASVANWLSIVIELRAQR